MPHSEVGRFTNNPLLKYVKKKITFNDLQTTIKLFEQYIRARIIIPIKMCSTIGNYVNYSY